MHNLSFQCIQSITYYCVIGICFCKHLLFYCIMTNNIILYWWYLFHGFIIFTRSLLSHVITMSQCRCICLNVVIDMCVDIIFFSFYKIFSSILYWNILNMYQIKCVSIDHVKHIMYKIFYVHLIFNQMTHVLYYIFKY